MEITMGQQYNNVGEKYPVLLYAYIKRHAGTQENTVKLKQCSTPSHMVAIMYYYMSYKYCKKPLHGMKRKIRTRLNLLSIPQSGGGKCQNV